MKLERSLLFCQFPGDAISNQNLQLEDVNEVITDELDETGKLVSSVVFLSFSCSCTEKIRK